MLEKYINSLSVAIEIQNLFCSRSYFLSFRFQLIANYGEDIELKLLSKDIVCNASLTWKRHRILNFCISYYLPQLPSFLRDLECFVCIKKYMGSRRSSPAHIHSAQRWCSGAGNDLVHQAITTRHQAVSSREECDVT
jgi:hypothetical protein